MIMMQLIIQATMVAKHPEEMIWKQNTGTPHPDNNTLGEDDMHTGGDNGAPSCPDDSTQLSSTPAQRNPEVTTVSHEVHIPSSTCGLSTTSSRVSSLGCESRSKPLSTNRTSNIA